MTHNNNWQDKLKAMTPNSSHNQSSAPSDQPKDSTPIVREPVQDQPVDSVPIQSSTPSDQVDESTPVKNKSTDKATNNKKRSVKITSNTLNVRKGPNKTSDVLFMLVENSVVTVLEDKGDWLFISTVEDRQGYIMTEFTEAVK